MEAEQHLRTVPNNSGQNIRKNVDTKKKFWPEMKEGNDKGQTFGICSRALTANVVFHEERRSLQKSTRENWPWPISSKFIIWFNGGIKKPLEKTFSEVLHDEDNRPKKMSFVKVLQGDSMRHSHQIGSVVNKNVARLAKIGLTTVIQITYVHEEFDTFKAGKVRKKWGDTVEDEVTDSIEEWFDMEKMRIKKFSSGKQRLCTRSHSNFQ